MISAIEEIIKHFEIKGNPFAFVVQSKNEIWYRVDFQIFEIEPMLKYNYLLTRQEFDVDGSSKSNQTIFLEREKLSFFLNCQNINCDNYRAMH